MFVPVPLVWNTLFITVTTPLSAVVCSSVRHISIGARFSHLIGFYHHFRCEVTGVPGVISEGGSSARQQLSEEGEEGGEMRNLVSAKLGFISALLSSFSLFPFRFLFTFIFIFFPPPSCCCTPSCVLVCCCCGSSVCKCVCVCVCVHHWGLRSLVMSHLSSSLAPHEAQVNYLHTNIPSLSKLWLQSLPCYIVWLCPTDDADLYLYLHILCLSSLSPAPASHSHNQNISQNPHDININIVSYSWIFLV